VLVVGAGVAGPILAVALRRAGIDCTVFEQKPADTDERGSWITFQANGVDALAAIDAAAPLCRLGFPVETASFVNWAGSDLGRVPMAGPGHGGQYSLMMRSADLYRALAQLAQERGAKVIYGKQMVDATTTPAGLEARFADGSVAAGDVLVGCDGIHSRVRSLVDPAAPPPRYVPVLNIGGHIPDFPVDLPYGELRTQFGRRCSFAWTPTPGGGVVWFANPPVADEPQRGALSTMSDRQWRSWLHELMAGDVGPSHQIIEAAPGPLMGWATYEMPVVRNWHNGGMLIIGDAAHAAVPSSAQGAAIALEDAVILAKCLRDCPDISSSFNTFEILRRARVEKIVGVGARSDKTKVARPFARFIRDLTLPIVSRRLARDGGRSMTWLQGHHIDFEQAVHPMALAAVQA
jgi:2-polyprenyl-6-methoxyphenol hydroxylase-like FAD-dependent oxidoreductase